MEISQLKTFVAVAREGSITRASERLFLSQPAVSAHIKAIEDTLGLVLFERTPRGMNLTHDGQRLLAKAEQTLDAHRELVAEAARLKGRLTGRLRLGAGSSSSSGGGSGGVGVDEALGRLLTILADRAPEVEVTLQHFGTSLEIRNGIRNGSLDAGFYNESDGSDAPELATIELARFGIYLAAPPGLVAGVSLPESSTSQSAALPDWKALTELTWICPNTSTCCGRAAESLFQMHGFRPKRIISIDRENVTRTLIAGGVGVGLLHSDAAKDAEARGEVELVCGVADGGGAQPVRVLFAYLAGRGQDPLMSAVSAIVDRFRPVFPLG